MIISEAYEYLAGIPKFTRKHPLEHTQKLIALLGNPSGNKKVIHVAGTNGKGSVCHYLQAIILASGHTVGMFTSPHLVRVNERFMINGEEVNDNVFLKAFTKVLTVSRSLEESGQGHPSYFEFLYAMGLLIFEESQVEYLVLETGLGGRLDATNSYQTPLVSVITSISLDHQQILGETIAEIAGEKAGIIREGVPVVADGSSTEAQDVISQVAKVRSAPLKVVTPEEARALPWQLSGSDYQRMNGALAVAAAGYLPLSVDQESLQRALEEVRIPGRMEEVLAGVYVEGAHNEAGIAAFCRNIQKEAFPVILFSAVSDKDVSALIKILCDNIEATAFVITGIKDARRASTEALATEFAKYTKCPIYQEEDSLAAFRLGYRLKGAKRKLYCVGSLYLVGEIKEALDVGF